VLDERIDHHVAQLDVGELFNVERLLHLHLLDQQAGHASLGHAGLCHGSRVFLLLSQDPRVVDLSQGRLDRDLLLCDRLRVGLAMNSFAFENFSDPL
jgi:hypothetical protein